MNNKPLIIVESPSKAKTISKYLDDKYEVLASIGHIKDLPKKDLGVDVENNFAIVEDILPDKESFFKELIDLANKTDQVVIATDPDREGEAIAAHIASEVDENAFFYSRETGGTIVSTALEEMLRIIEDRYPAEEWNIYAAQASDGDNLNSDNSHCQTLLSERLLPLCQYFTYIEIWDQHEIEMFPHDQKASRLWQAYEQVMKGRQNFVMKNVSRPQDILPVFHELFSRTHTAGSTAKLAEGIQTGAATS